ncbi:MAG: hypothetical protein WBL40_00690 [Terrimicrobiaceae bacterium]
MTALLRDALPPTQRRMQENTAAAVNEQNRRQTDRNVERFAAQDRADIAAPPFRPGADAWEKGEAIQLQASTSKPTEGQ